MDFVRKILSLGTKLIVHITYRTKITGFENIPKQGPGIIVSNHISYMDGLLIHTACKRRVRFIIFKEIYNKPIVNFFMKLNRAIPIAPNKHDVTHALKEVKSGLDNGDLICIFPEGSLSHSGNMKRFRFGIEWILRESPVNVYPVALGGLWGSIFSRKYENKHFRFLPRSLFRKVTATCGKAIPANKATLSVLQKRIMKLKSLN